MKQKAMDMKLVVKPLVGCLTHTHFWEGPCRAGHKEDMTVEAETKAADEAFKNSVKGLQGVIDEVEFTEPVDVRYTGLGSSAFARRYLRNRCFFLFLRVLRCFSSPGSLP